MTTGEAIAVLERLQNYDVRAGLPRPSAQDEYPALALAIEALREKEANPTFCRDCGGDLTICGDCGAEFDVK
jgi:hypothetical protein